MITKRRRRRVTTVETGPSWDVSTCCLEPLYNVRVLSDEVVITADLPYADPETVEVEQRSIRTWEIRAKMKRKFSFKEFGITHRQGEFEIFKCQTRIPVLVDAKRMKKELKRNFLVVHLPRKKAKQTKVEQKKH